MGLKIEGDDGMEGGGGGSCKFPFISSFECYDERDTAVIRCFFYPCFFSKYLKLKIIHRYKNVPCRNKINKLYILMCYL